MKKYILVLSVSVFIGCSKAHTADTSHHPLSPATLKLAMEMDDQAKQAMRLPALPQQYSADRYFNTTPAALLPDSLRGKVVLLDIWDYTCVNCIRTLPYIKSWAEKYRGKGLVVIGIHSPEFDFEKNTENLKAAISKFGLTYPNIADNEYEVWNSLKNQYWPAKYLYDKNGVLRTTHFGEGEYREFEAFLQKILYERDSTIDLPPIGDVVRASDKPGSVCYRPTPETYLGFEKSHPGNRERMIPNIPVKFTLPTNPEPDRIYFEGKWKTSREFVAPGGENASMLINYQAKEVNLVIRPQAEPGFKVYVEQDGKPISKEDRGPDIQESDGKTFLRVMEPRMYAIINNSKYGHFTLRLKSDSPSFGAYAFTFTTDCKAE